MTKIEVRALPAKGFWRAGRYWPHEPTEAEVDEATLERLLVEPMLSVNVLGEAEEPQETPLPAGFPHKERLEAAGFTSLESLHQIQANKLYAKGFKKPEVEEVQAAVLAG